MVNTLHAVYYLQWLSKYEIKRISHPTHISKKPRWECSTFDQFSKQINTSFQNQTKKFVIFSHLVLLILIIAHDLKPSRKCANIDVIRSCGKILHE